MSKSDPISSFQFALMLLTEIVAGLLVLLSAPLAFAQLTSAFPNLAIDCTSATIMKAEKDKLISNVPRLGYISSVPGKPEEGILAGGPIFDSKGNKIEVWCLKARFDNAGKRIHGGPDLGYLFTPANGKAVWIGACTFDEGNNNIYFHYNRSVVPKTVVVNRIQRNILTFEDKFTGFTWLNYENPDRQNPNAVRNANLYEYNVQTNKLKITKVKGKYRGGRYTPDEMDAANPIDAPEQFEGLKFRDEQLTLGNGDLSRAIQPFSLVLNTQSPSGRFEYTLVAQAVRGTGTPEDPFLGVETMVEPGDVITIPGFGIHDPSVAGLASQSQFGGWVVDAFSDTSVSFKARNSVVFRPGTEVPGFILFSDADVGQVPWAMTSSNEMSGSAGYTTGPFIANVTGSTNRVGVVPPPGNDAGAQVRVLVKFPFVEPVNLGAATVTLNSLLVELGPDGAGELVTGTDGVPILPLILTARPGGGPDAAIFETPLRSIPKVLLEIQTKGQGLFDWLLKVDRGTIPVFPQLCAGAPRLTTDLTTSFTIDDGVNPPVVVSTEQPWRCLDLMGGDPKKPRSLRVP
jgi:hypothetical protein